MCDLIALMELARPDHGSQFSSLALRLLSNISKEGLVLGFRGLTLLDIWEMLCVMSHACHMDVCVQRRYLHLRPLHP